MALPHTAASRSKGVCPLVVIAQVLACALLLAHPASAQSCASAGTVRLALTAAGSPADLSAPYAVCFARFSLTVDSACSLTLTPNNAGASYLVARRNETVDQPCYSSALRGGSISGTVGVHGALRRAFASSTLGADFNTLTSVAPVTPGTIASGMLVTIGTKTFTFSVVSGSLGSGSTSVVTAAASTAGGATPATSCAAGSYLDGGLCPLCPPGSSCAGGTAAPVPCAAGTVAAGAGATSCSSCPVDTYQAATGQTSCDSCPDDSYAHFTGSVACIACYFGEPVVIAGTGGLYPDNMPAEQPRGGFRVATLAATNALTDKTKCTVNPFTAACNSMASRTIAIETDATCAVRMYVLGDSSCSNADDLTVLEGAYDDDTKTIIAAGSAANTRLVLQFVTVGGNPQVSLAEQSSGVATTCTATLSLPSVSGNSLTCPTGTSPDTNPQLADLQDVFIATGTPVVFASKQCAPCDTGSKCPNGIYAACEAGSFSNTIGAQACSTCPDGTASEGGTDSCFECDPGSIPAANKATCTLCPGGQYSTLPGTSTCTICPAGTFRPTGSGDGRNCTACAPGSFSAAGATKCTPCPRGTYADNPGQKNACKSCPAGQYADGEGSPFCNVCPPQSFSATAGSPTCTPCPDGRITRNVNGAGATQCEACARGTFRPAEATDNKCRSCPAGYQTGVNGTGASTCTECDPGYFASLPNTPLCSACAPGTFATGTGNKACRVCPAGQVTGLTPTTTGASGKDATAAAKCDLCPRRTFRPSMYAANACTPCPRGRELRSETGASTCTACAPGYSLIAPNDLKCTACGPGEFAQRPGMSGQCAKCPKGQAVSDDGNTVCDVCPPGTYQDSEGSTTCAPCEEGTYNEMGGSTSVAACQPAPKGSFAAGVGNDGYTPCEGGTYQDEEGQGSCKPCPAGSQCPPGSVAPEKCRPGFYADLKQPFCKPCEVGSFNNKEGARACQPCPAGSSCPATMLTVPQACPAGTYGVKFSAKTRNDCARCPANSFTSTTGRTSCTRCGESQWTARQTGQTQCWSTSLMLPPQAQRRGSLRL